VMHNSGCLSPNETGFDEAVAYGSSFLEQGVPMLDGTDLSDSSTWVAVIPAVYTPPNHTQTTVHGVATLRGSSKEIQPAVFRLAIEVMNYLGRVMYEVNSEVEGLAVARQRDVYVESIIKITNAAVSGDPRDLLTTSMAHLLQLIGHSDRVQLCLWDSRKHKAWVLDSTLQEDEGIIGQWEAPTGLVKQVLWQGTTVSLGPRTIANCFDKKLDELSDYNTCAIMALPLRPNLQIQANKVSAAVVGGPRPGVLVVRSSDPSVTFTDRDHQLLESYTGLLSNALDSSRAQRYKRPPPTCMIYPYPVSIALSINALSFDWFQ